MFKHNFVIVMKWMNFSVMQKIFLANLSPNQLFFYNFQFFRSVGNVIQQIKTCRLAVLFTMTHEGIYSLILDEVYWAI